MIDLSTLQLNERNPRKITKAKLEALKRDITGFEEMLNLRGIVIDEKNVIKGGNQRYRALLELGYTEVPDEWVKQEKNFTQEQWRKFVILDNREAGEWDDEILAEDYTFEELEEWEMATDQPKETTIGEMEFSDELLLEHNYVVLYFDNPMDWQVAIDKLGLKEVKSAIKTQKSQKVGIGRVIRGADIISRI